MRKIFFYKNRWSFILTLVTIMIESGMYVGIAFFLKALMEVATRKDIYQLLHILIIIGFILPCYVLVALIKRKEKNKFLECAACRYKERYFKSTLEKGIANFQQETSARPMSALTNDFNSIEQNLLEGYFSIWNCLTQLIFGLCSMIWLNWVLTIVIVTVCCLPVLVSLMFTPKQQKLEKMVSGRNEFFISFVKDILSGFTVIKSFQSEKQINHLFIQNNAQLEMVKRNRRNTSDFISILAEVSSLLVNIVIFTVGVLLAIWGYLEVSSLIAFFQLLNNVITPLQQLSPLLVRKKAAEALIDKAEHSLLIQDDISKEVKLSDFKNQIQIENLSYTYEKGKKPVLKNISFTFKKGKSYAIVGASGSGKSTLLHLLQQYSDEYEGQILIDGTELKKISSDSLYSLISVIQQNVFIFDDTIQENITLYQHFSDEQISNAIQKSGLSYLISEKGKNYPCGENGVYLSGGEKQRVSIARSLLRNAPILLMDEATAALDAETSKMVEEAILSLDGLTRIIITHKLIPDLLKKYDYIIVMDHGKISESGQYETLITQRGLFYSLCRLSGTQ